VTSEPPDRTNAQLAAWAAMFRANALFNGRIDDVLKAKAGMSLAEHELLAVLKYHDGRARMGDLARALMFSKSGATRLVAKLEDHNGWVVRTRSSADRRATWAELTPAGRKALTTSELAFEAAIAELFATHLGLTELRRITTDLERLIAANDWEAPGGSCAEDLAPDSHDVS
jgi:DNA-binding MarR family transcriptional regulator